VSSPVERYERLIKLICSLEVGLTCHGCFIDNLCGDVVQIDTRVRLTHRGLIFFGNLALILVFLVHSSA
jgi:hypothetical protein